SCAQGGMMLDRLLCPRVGVDVRLDVDPFLACLVDQPDHLVHLAPQTLVGNFEVEDFDPDARPPADGDDFLDRGQHAGPLVADVGHEDAAVAGRYLAQLDERVDISVGKQESSSYGCLKCLLSACNAATQSPAASCAATAGKSTPAL